MLCNALLFVLLTQLFLPIASETVIVTDSQAFSAAVSASKAGDQILLEAGEYILSDVPNKPAPITIENGITIRSRDKNRRAVLRGDSTSTLFYVVASDVHISDLIIGKQLSGGDERSIDVFIASGTTSSPTNPNSYRDTTQQLGGQVVLTPRNEIVVARDLLTAGATKVAQLQKRSVPAGSQRIISNVDITNVDFSSSKSGTNIAFGSGSYSDIVITHCVFGRSGITYINSIVAVSDALFVDLNVSNNAFTQTVVLFGSSTTQSSSFTNNFWLPANSDVPIYIGGVKPLATATFCMDRSCNTLGPIVDLDVAGSVFASLEEAVASATRIRIVSDITINTPIVISKSGTTIEGGEGCAGAPLITIRTGASIVSFNNALVGVRNLRFALIGSSTSAFVYTDGVAQNMAVAKFSENWLTATGAIAASGGSDNSRSLVVGFDGVSILGDGSKDQAAIVLNTPRVHLDLEDAVLAQTEYGVVDHRGTFAAVDSAFFSHNHAAIYAETTTRQAGIRVTGSTIAGCKTPIEFGAAATTKNLRDVRVTCSQFLFNEQINPITSRDCSKEQELCSGKVKYNTIITDLPEPSTAQQLTNAVRAERRMLTAGSNHIENGRDRSRFVYFGAGKEFLLQGNNGRVTSVSGTLDSSDSVGSFLLSTYAPMRPECLPLDAAQFGNSPTAKLVSNVLEVRSDKLLHECATLGVNFRIANTSLLPALDALGVYGVTHLGEKAQWQLEASTVYASPSPNTPAMVRATLSVYDASSHHNHRIVIVSDEAMPDAVAQAAVTGAAVTTDQQRAITRTLCVACGGIDIPSDLVLEFCNSNSENIRGSFDEAYEELGFGKQQGPRQEAVSIFVYGQCKTKLCRVTIDQNENIEGASKLIRGSLARDETAVCKTDDAFVVFSDRASKATLRHMVIDGKSSESAGVCTISVAGSTISTGPTIAYSSISGTLCVDSRAGGRYIGNDIAGADVAVLFDFREQPVARGSTVKKRDTPHPEAIVFEANQIALGNVYITGTTIALTPAVALWELRVYRNNFQSVATGFVVNGHSVAIKLRDNTNIGLLDMAVATTVSLTAAANTFAKGASVALHNHATIDFPPGSIAEWMTLYLYDHAHINDVAFDVLSRVIIMDKDSEVVLRQVIFEDINKTLKTEYQFAACEQFELSVAGIDLLRSSIYDADGFRIMTQQQSTSVVANGGTAYFSRTDGRLMQCANNVAPIRTSDVCGCPESIAAKSVASVAEGVVPKKIAAVTAVDDASTDAVVDDASFAGMSDDEQSEKPKNNNNNNSDDDDAFLLLSSSEPSGRSLFFLLFFILPLLCCVVCIGVSCFSRYRNNKRMGDERAAMQMGDRGAARESTTGTTMSESTTTSTQTTESETSSTTGKPKSINAFKIDTQDTASAIKNAPRSTQRRKPKKANDPHEN